MGKLIIAGVIVGVTMAGGVVWRWTWTRGGARCGHVAVGAPIQGLLEIAWDDGQLNFPVSMKFLKEHRLCYNCFEKGHPSAVCPKRRFPRCMNCGKFGHRAYKCPSKPQTLECSTSATLNPKP